MAQLLEAFTDRDKNTTLKEICTRPFPNLPEHVLGQVKWLNNIQYPGYYLWNPNTGEQEQVEFRDNYWYFVYRDKETYISKDDCNSQKL